MNFISSSSEELDSCQKVIQVCNKVQEDNFEMTISWIFFTKIMYYLTLKVLQETKATREALVLKSESLT